jgi:beta-galactosidase
MAPAAVRLLPEVTTVKANGQSLVYVPFEIIDENGVVNPNADNLVEISVDGPATLAAVGNGDPSSLESFQQPKRKAYRGEGLIILRSTQRPGTIKLTAKSKNLKAATTTIIAK